MKASELIEEIQGMVDIYGDLKIMLGEGEGQFEVGGVKYAGFNPLTLLVECAGLTDEFDSRWDSTYNEGLKEGRDQGFEEGRDKGYRQGKDS